MPEPELHAEVQHALRLLGERFPAYMVQIADSQRLAEALADYMSVAGCDGKRAAAVIGRRTVQGARRPVEVLVGRCAAATRTVTERSARLAPLDVPKRPRAAGPIPPLRLWPPAPRHGHGLRRCRVVPYEYPGEAARRAVLSSACALLVLMTAVTIVGRDGQVTPTEAFVVPTQVSIVEPPAIAGAIAAGGAVPQSGRGPSVDPTTPAPAIATAGATGAVATTPEASAFTTTPSSEVLPPGPTAAVSAPSSATTVSPASTPTSSGSEVGVSEPVVEAGSETDAPLVAPGASQTTIALVQPSTTVAESVADVPGPPALPPITESAGSNESSAPTAPERPGASGSTTVAATEPGAPTRGPRNGPNRPLSGVVVEPNAPPRVADEPNAPPVAPLVIAPIAPTAPSEPVADAPEVSGSQPEVTPGAVAPDAPPTPRPPRTNPPRPAPPVTESPPVEPVPVEAAPVAAAPEAVPVVVEPVVAAPEVAPGVAAPVEVAPVAAAPVVADPAAPVVVEPVVAAPLPVADPAAVTPVVADPVVAAPVDPAVVPVAEPAATPTPTYPPTQSKACSPNPRDANPRACPYNPGSGAAMSQSKGAPPADPYYDPSVDDAPVTP